ncbi:MAG TPA: hypothetical protein VF771_20330 [Longimicrobiaceae bacterium]
MRKPVSKHALRRALEAVHAEGRIRWDQPTGSVVDRVWHHIEKQAHGQRRKPVIRDSVRAGEPAAV